MKLLSSIILPSLLLITTAAATEGQQGYDPRLVDLGRVDQEKIEKQRKRLAGLIQDVEVNADSLAMSLYHARSKSYLSVRVRWTAYQVVAERINPCKEKPPMSSEMTLVESKIIHAEPALLGGYNSADQGIVVAAVDSNKILRWVMQIGDPRVENNAIPLPGQVSKDDCPEAHITRPEFPLELPDDQEIKELRLYLPIVVDGRTEMKLLSALPLDVRNLTNASTRPE